MSPTSLLTTLWALVAVTVVTLSPREGVGADNGAARAATSCEDGEATYWRPYDASPFNDAHELAHAWHCQQTGDLTEAPPAQLFPFARIPARPATYLEAWREHGPVRWYCWSGLRSDEFDGDLNESGPLAEAEWFACMVERALVGDRDAQPLVSYADLSGATCRHVDGDTICSGPIR